MVQFSVTPQYVADAATQSENTGNDVLAQLTELRNYVTSLVGETDIANGPADAYAWMGVTAAQFAALMENVHFYSLAIHDDLLGIAQGLRGNYVNYVNSEADNLQGLKGIDENLLGSVPPARL
jgi:hypothetical protein